MIHATRWTGLALFLLSGLVGCDPTDASKLPESTPAIQEQAQQIERFKSRTTKPVRKPGR